LKQPLRRNQELLRRDGRSVFRNWEQKFSEQFASEKFWKYERPLTIQTRPLISETTVNRRTTVNFKDAITVRNCAHHAHFGENRLHSLHKIMLRQMESTLKMVKKRLTFPM
jgi:hypothetical protein